MAGSAEGRGGLDRPSHLRGGEPAPEAVNTAPGSVITEVARIEEVSIVTDPKDKRRRIVAISDDDGIKRDYLTWRPVEDGPQ